MLLKYNARCITRRVLLKYNAGGRMHLNATYTLCPSPNVCSTNSALKINLIQTESISPSSINRLLLSVKRWIHWYNIFQFQVIKKWVKLFIYSVFLMALVRITHKQTNQVLHTQFDKYHICCSSTDLVREVGSGQPLLNTENLKLNNCTIQWCILGASNLYNCLCFLVW